MIDMPLLHWIVVVKKVPKLMVPILHWTVVSQEGFETS